MKREIYRIFMAGGMWRWAETLIGQGIWDREEADAKAAAEEEQARVDAAAGTEQRPYFRPILRAADRPEREPEQESEAEQER